MVELKSQRWRRYQEGEGETKKYGGERNDNLLSASCKKNSKRESQWRKVDGNVDKSTRRNTRMNEGKLRGYNAYQCASSTDKR